ncbi:type 1 glutamine amidotransferase [Streptomyces sp. NPDC002133]|uniref:type 1 glutamine amidotransferase n=1 Tax=Streptomyces sp. NPDC002133 TaxID=3154409 RepID=UPI00331FC75C
MTERSWHVLQHVPYEGPALITTAATKAGADLHIHRMWEGAPLPSITDTAGLIVLGGPMNAMDDANHPHLADERRLLTDALSARIPILGICLGAQLLAAAAGADVTQGPEFEIGAGTVTLTPAASNDPLLTGLNPALPVFHWHQDTFTLPAGARLLASSTRYAHQAFRVGPTAWGLQFHIEVDAAAIDALRHLLPDHARPSAHEMRAVAAIGRTVLPRLFQLG